MGLDHVWFDWEELGKVMKERRMALGLTQEAVAQEIHVDHTTITRLEGGRIKTQPNMDMFASLAVLYGLNFTLLEDRVVLVPGDEMIEEGCVSRESTADERRENFWAVLFFSLEMIFCGGSLSSSILAMLGTLSGPAATILMCLFLAYSVFFFAFSIRCLRRRGISILR